MTATRSRGSRSLSSSSSPSWVGYVRDLVATSPVGRRRGSGGRADEPAEQRPVPVVAVHGLLAVTTVVLVLLSALEV